MPRYRKLGVIRDVCRADFHKITSCPGLSNSLPLWYTVWNNARSIYVISFHLQTMPITDLQRCLSVIKSRDVLDRIVHIDLLPHLVEDGVRSLNSWRLIMTLWHGHTCCITDLVREIHRSPVDYLHEGPVRYRALMFCLILTRTSCRTNSWISDDLRCYKARVTSVQCLNVLKYKERHAFHGSYISTLPTKTFLGWGSNM